jgi:NDP-sugar pyrophosphorylase family protein
MALTAVVLAAGAGTRLGVVGTRTSKAMLPVAGQPLVEWVFAMLERAGVERLVVVGHPSDTELARLTRSRGNATLVLQAERRGIADALTCALPALAGEAAYLACACDSLYRVPEVRRLIDTGRSLPQAAAVAVLEMDRAATASRSAVRLQGNRVIDIVEKPRPGTVDSPVVALPLYWLPSAIAPFCGAAARDGNERYVSTALRSFIQSGGNVLAVPMTARIEITTPTDIEAAEHYLAQTPSWLDSV